MRPIRLVLFAAFLSLFSLAALTVVHAEAQVFAEVPDVLRPGKYYNFKVHMPYDGSATLSLLDESGQPYYAIYSGYPLLAGENTLGWDGRRADQSIVEEGAYLLCITLDDGTDTTSPIRIGAPYPIISHITQSDALVDQGPIVISFRASDDGTLDVQLRNSENGTTYKLPTLGIQKGENSYQWEGMVDNARVAEGEYALMLTLQTPNGMESMSEYVYVQVEPAQTAATNGFHITDMAYADEYVEPSEATQAPVMPSVSPPYSSTLDDTFWSMSPGELDDQVIWDIMMQPIIVYNDGKIDAKEHVYLMENPDGTGAKIAQIHGTSQGLHVIGEVNEHGYILVEAFSNYDRSYSPLSDEERAHAFELKQGYIKAGGLKTVEVQSDMALLIDKLTQRMYLFIDGVRVTEFLISTGKITGTDYLFETIPGEYITVSHTGTLVDGNMNCAMAIRINGGILVHEVPHKLNADGSKNYSSFEGYLGTKQSHGCIRVQRLKTPEGYNQKWIWENFKRGKPYKVLIWDDVNRYDTPATWQENPKN